MVSKVENDPLLTMVRILRFGRIITSEDVASLWDEE
jgi:hypothetical protein